MTLGPSSSEATTFLTALRSGYTFVKLHIGDPGSAGTANPAVNTTRIATTWTALATVSGVMGFENVGSITWTAVPASEDYTHYSLWSLVSGGAFGHSGIIVAAPAVAAGNFIIPAGALDVSLPVAA